MFKTSYGVKKIFFLGLGIVLLAAACNKSATTTGNSNNNSSQTVSQTPEIDITENGFKPSEITVKQGTSVIFKNTDTDGHWPASNPHPTHTDLPGFDALQPIATGNTYSYTFTKLGTWGYHDHLHPNLHGSVIVTP
jgi:plastocyanin